MSRTEIGRIMKAISEAQKEEDVESMKKALMEIRMSWARNEYK